MRLGKRKRERERDRERERNAKVSRHFEQVWQLTAFLKTSNKTKKNYDCHRNVSLIKKKGHFIVVKLG